MNTDTQTIETPCSEERGTLRSYTMGFVLSIILTLLPYKIVVEHLLSGGSLIAAIFGFAIAQLFVQVIFFLHLGREEKPRWNSMVFAFTVFVVIFLVIGSLWIMANLKYNMSDTPMLHRGEGYMPQ